MFDFSAIIVVHRCSHKPNLAPSLSVGMDWSHDCGHEDSKIFSPTWSGCVGSAGVVGEHHHGTMELDWTLIDDQRIAFETRVFSLVEGSLQAWRLKASTP